MQRAREAFEFADIEERGLLTKHQYKIAMTVVFGNCPDQWEVKEVFESYPDRLVPFEQFQNWVRRKMCSSSDLMNLETLFIYLDGNFNGQLTLRDLVIASKNVHLRIPKIVLENAFKELDRFKKGCIGLEEFVLCMREQKY